MHETMTIQGIQIALRDWQTDDLEPYAHWLAPGQRWKEFDGPYYPGPTADKISEIIDRKQAEIVARNYPTPRTNLVIAEQVANTLAGCVTWYWESRETNWLSVGITIFDPALWGRGIGYEALGLWSDYLFRHLPAITRLDLRTWSGNHGMMRLAEKLGYAEEARFRKARIVDGRYYDGMGYGVLREEWDQRYPNGFAQHLHQR